MRKRIMGAALAVLVAGVAVPAQAAIQWADWTAGTSSSATGTIGGVGITVATTANGVGFVQTGAGGETDFWNGTYTSSWDGTIAPPSTTDIVALNAGGLKTITFSEAVSNVYLALNSWNAQRLVTFDTAFTTVGFVNGCGYWGCGLPQNVTATSFTSVDYTNEIHGILKFSGPVTSISFTDSNDEYWHGISLGLDSAVPEPATWAMMIVGFGAIGATMRRRRRSPDTATA